MADHALLLHAGGLRSLVALAWLRHESSHRKVTLLHAIDGRPTSQQRLAHVHRQADDFGIEAVVERDLPHLFSGGRGQRMNKPRAELPTGPLVATQLLLLSLAEADRVGAGYVVWPQAVQEDAAAVGRCTQQVLLAEELLALEAVPDASSLRSSASAWGGGGGGGGAVHIRTPLLELADAELVKLGHRLGVDWSTAWSCVYPGEEPCRGCVGCRRRKRAFDAAGLAENAEPRAAA